MFFGNESNFVLQIKEENMNWWEKVKAFLEGKKIELTPEEETALKGMEPKPTNSNIIPRPQDDAVIETLRAELRQSTEQNQAIMKLLADEKKAREDSVKTLQEDSAKRRAAEIDAIIKEAGDKGKLHPKNEDEIKRYRTLLEKDFDTAKAIIDSMQETKATTKPDDKGAGDGAVDDITQETKPLNRIKLMNDAKAAFKDEVPVN